MEAKDRIIVALDVSSLAAAENLIRELALYRKTGFTNST
jgi:orotidine-5'-phosphate decarboxylase